jgi:hypothetical protein
LKTLWPDRIEAVLRKHMGRGTEVADKLSSHFAFNRYGTRNPQVD